MASPLINIVEMQIAFAIALLGIYLGWRAGYPIYLDSMT